MGLNRTRSQMRKTKLHFNWEASVMIFQNHGGRRGTQLEFNLKILSSWKILSWALWDLSPATSLKLDSSKQRDTQTTSPETLLQELYSYTWLSWSQIPDCYQQLSQGFALLLNHPSDSSSTPSSSIPEAHLGLSLHSTAPPQQRAWLPNKHQPHWLLCCCCTELWGTLSAPGTVLSSLLGVAWAPHRAPCAGLPEHTWGSFCKGCCKAQGGRAVHSQGSLTLPCLTASSHPHLRQTSSLTGEHFFSPLIKQW